MIHDMGALCLFEGVEDKDQAILAISSNADLLQGYYFGRPLPEPVDVLQNTISFDTLAKAGFDMGTAAIKARRKHHTPYIQALEKALADLKTEVDFSPLNLQALLNMPDTLRCFLIDHQGSQVGINMAAPHHAKAMDARFMPLESTANASWRHRPYFVAALADIDNVHVSRPYFSITGARQCITLAGAVMTPKGLRVLCCDLAVDGPFQTSVPPTVKPSISKEG
jgi:hypothetical protein